MEDGTAQDARKTGLPRVVLSLVSVLVAAFGASLPMTALMWLWDVYAQRFEPPPDYDPPPPNYFAYWLILGVVMTAYGLLFGLALQWLSRRLKKNHLPFTLVANLLCGCLIGLAADLAAASLPVADSQGTFADYVFLFALAAGGAVLWGLIFLVVRRPDRDRPKDISTSVF